jgi:hypothetical protein
MGRSHFKRQRATAVRGRLDSPSGEQDPPAARPQVEVVEAGGSREDDHPLVADDTKLPEKYLFALQSLPRWWR